MIENNLFDNKNNVKETNIIKEKTKEYDGYNIIDDIIKSIIFILNIKLIILLYSLFQRLLFNKEYLYDNYIIFTLICLYKSVHF